jgi:hypothetical protein
MVSEKGPNASIFMSTRTRHILSISVVSTFPRFAWALPMLSVIRSSTLLCVQKMEGRNKHFCAHTICRAPHCRKNDCPPGLTLCDGNCYDLTDNDLNCGSCNNVYVLYLTYFGTHLSVYCSTVLMLRKETSHGPKISPGPAVG